ncbi:hypothetical protein V2J09_016020 [Rumex salicifolius]
MPSANSKRQSKSKSRLSKSDAFSSPSPSPRTHSVSNLNPCSELGEDELLSRIEEASTKFPSLIGNSALIGRVSDGFPRLKGCKIWLSEPSMVASSISPGSIVSVSLPRSGTHSSSMFPLSPLTAESSAHFGLDDREGAANAPGNYFVLATVFPSCKVLKDEVQLSSNLSNSLGCPASGRAVFVYPVQTGSLRNHLSGDYKYSRFDEKSFLSYKCKQLYLEPLPFQRVLKIKSPINDLPKASSYTTLDQFENGEVSSPQTPSRCSRIASSPPTNELRLSGDLAGLPSSSVAGSGLLDVKEMFGNDTVKKLLEDCAVSWLCNRSLLCKNIVTFSSLAKVYTFRVLCAERLSSDGVDTVDKYSFEDAVVAYVIDEKTKVSICLPEDLSNATGKRILTPQAEQMEGIPNTNEVQKLGGLWKEYAVLMDIISSPVKNALSDLGLRTTKGVLLYGPPGTGKTSLAHLCASDAGVNFFKVNGPEIIKQYNGESEQELHKVFDAASKVAPAVIFIDELDAIAPARKEGGDELSQRVVATLLNLMDGISRTQGLLIIAATNRIDSIEPALRRPGRLDREIEIGVPSPQQRLDIMKTSLNKMDHSLVDSEVEHLAMVAHGFVGADLAALCNEAAIACLRRYIEHKRSLDYTFYLKETTQSCNSDSCVSVDNAHCFKASGDHCLDSDLASASRDVMNSPEYVLSSCSSQVANENKCAVDVTSVCSISCITDSGEGLLKVSLEDFEKAKMRVRPSAMREVMLEVPRVKWEDVGGQEEIKQQLMEAVEWPQKHHDAFKRIGTRPPTGVLMFGPPGCSKTLMARAVASEAGLNFLAVKGPELFSKWVGETEKAVRSLFAKARANAPSIIFFDEIDSLAVTRGRESDGTSVDDRVMSQLLVELDGLHQRVNVTVIAATNRPDKIDPALLRPGRFDRMLYVGPPSEKERVDIFNIHLRKMPCSPDVDRIVLSRLTEGFTGADISLICREAAMKALEENFVAAEIKMEHLRAAVEHVPRSEVEPYQNLSENFQRLVRTKDISDGLTVASQSKGTLSDGFSGSSMDSYLHLHKVGHLEQASKWFHIGIVSLGALSFIYRLWSCWAPYKG